MGQLMYPDETALYQWVTISEGFVISDFVYWLTFHANTNSWIPR